MPPRKKKCVVCKRKAKQRCNNCPTWYCGKKHRNEDWPNHSKKTGCGAPKVVPTVPTPKCVVCQEDASQRCDVCQWTWYCGKEHQDNDLPNHEKTACLPFEIQYFRGRSCVIATRDIKKGDMIVNEEPFVVGPDFLVQPVLCPGCLNPLPLRERCPECSQRVCSKKCPGLKHPLLHGGECEFFKSTKLVLPTIKLLIPLRLILLQKNDPEKWKVLLEMGSRKLSITRIWKYVKIRSLFDSTVLKALSIYATKVPLDLSTEAVDHVFAFAETYGIEFKLPHTGELLGAGKLASSMQHSCLPNTRRVFLLTAPYADEPFQCRIIIRAAQDIKINDNITASVVRNLKNTCYRQRSLVEARGLYCYCERCLDPRELGTNFNTLICPKCSGDVLPIDTKNILQSLWLCHGKCAIVYPASFPSETVKTAIEGLGPSVGIEYSPAKLEALLADLEKKVHTNHYLAIKMKMRMIGLYGAVDEDDQQMTRRMATLGLSAVPGAVDVRSVRLYDENIERKAELCQQVLDVIAHPRFECSDGTLDTCLTQLALSKIEIAKRKRETGAWDEERTQKAFEEGEALLDRAANVRLVQSEDLHGIIVPL